jgi:hypothetical protein
MALYESTDFTAGRNWGSDDTKCTLGIGLRSIKMRFASDVSDKIEADFELVRKVLAKRVDRVPVSLRTPMGKARAVGVVREVESHLPHAAKRRISGSLST